MGGKLIFLLVLVLALTLMFSRKRVPPLLNPFPLKKSIRRVETYGAHAPHLKGSTTEEPGQAGGPSGQGGSVWSSLQGWDACGWRSVNSNGPVTESACKRSPTSTAACKRIKQRFMSHPAPTCNNQTRIEICTIQVSMNIRYMAL